MTFFGVSVDAEDQQRLASQQWPGIRFFWDLELEVSRKYGAIIEPPPSPQVEMPVQSPVEGGDATTRASPRTYRPHTLVLDHGLRVLAALELSGDPAAHLNQLLAFVADQPRLNQLSFPAPVLVVPYVFEWKLCQTLMEYYEAHGGEDSGFMRDIEGKTVAVNDHSHKRRSDCQIKDQALIARTQERLSRRIVPAIRQAFQFHASRIERNIVACYDAATGGHFRAHRDNTTLGTAHRRLAISINLNAEEFEGGELWFPEFGSQRYRPPTGGAIVFSCSLLHEATPVTKGRRYAFLPFLYDDAAARIREQNRKFIGSESSVQGSDHTGTENGTELKTGRVQLIDRELKTGRAENGTGPIN